MNLSGLGIGLLALVCLAGIAQQWSGDVALPTWRLGAAVLVAGLCYEWLHSRRKRLSASGEGETALHLGRRQRVSLQLHNGGPRTILLQYAPGIPAEIDCSAAESDLSIAARGRATIDFELTASEPGAFTWPSLPARARGVLGLAWWRCPLPLNIRFSAIPDLAGPRGSAPGNIHAGDQSARPGPGQELHHLREYEQGDPRHTIDWKATARTRRLITRVFSEEQHLDIMLLLDVGRTCRTQVDGLSQLAHYVNLAARFAEHAVVGGDQVGLVAAADRPQVMVPPQGGMRAVRDVRAALGRIEPVSQETDLLAASQQIQQILRKRALVIVLTDLFGQSFSGGFGRSLRFLSVRHLPMVVGLLGHDVTELADGEAGSRREVMDALAASEYREHLRRNAVGANRLGASAILCHPAELEVRVLEEYRLLKSHRRV